MKTTREVGIFAGPANKVKIGEIVWTPWINLDDSKAGFLDELVQMAARKYLRERGLALAERFEFTVLVKPPNALPNGNQLVYATGLIATQGE